MKKNQFEALNSIRSEDKIVSLKDIANKKDRTLLYGYTCERDTFHVYIRHGELHRIVYNREDHKPLAHDHGESLKLDSIVPDKKLYPEACDFDFCALLVKSGVNLPFTTWDDTREEKTFYASVAQPSGNLSAWVSVK